MKQHKQSARFITAISIFMAVILVSSFPSSSRGQTVADLVILNAKIITVDANNTIAQAVAVKDGLFIKVGTDQPVEMPSLFALYQNYPNPFNSLTEISYHLPATGSKMPVHVTLEVYSILGERVRTLVNKDETPGLYTVQWDGKNEEGTEVSSGVYLCRMSAGGFVQTRPMLLQK